MELTNHDDNQRRKRAMPELRLVATVMLVLCQLHGCGDGSDSDSESAKAVESSATEIESSIQPHEDLNSETLIARNAATFSRIDKLFAAKIEDRNRVRSMSDTELCDYFRSPKSSRYFESLEILRRHIVLPGMKKADVVEKIGPALGYSPGPDELEEGDYGPTSVTSALVVYYDSSKTLVRIASRPEGGEHPESEIQISIDGSYW